MNFKDLVKRERMLRTDIGVQRKTAPTIPETIIASAVKKLDEVAALISPYLPPTEADKKNCRNHPFRREIVRLTTKDQSRKNFFTRDYFAVIFESLPEDRKIIKDRTPKRFDHARDAIILYHYVRGKFTGFEGLENFRRKLEEDYLQDPRKALVDEARQVFSDLLGEENEAEIEATLLRHYPEEADVEEFTRIVGIKIPGLPKSKKAPRPTIHQRAAQAIYKEGELTRI